MFLFANCSHNILGQAILGEVFNMTSGNFAKHIFVKSPKKTFLTVKMALDRC